MVVLSNMLSSHDCCGSDQAQIPVHLHLHTIPIPNPREWLWLGLYGESPLEILGDLPWNHHEWSTKKSVLYLQDSPLRIVVGPPFHSDLPGNNPLLYEDWAISDLFRDKRHRQRSLISIIVFQLKTLLTHITHVWSIPQCSDYHPSVKQLDCLSQSLSYHHPTRMLRNLIPSCIIRINGQGASPVIRYKLWHARWGEAGWPLTSWPRDTRPHIVTMSRASDRKWAGVTSSRGIIQHEARRQ